jgi:hypothetical protein
MRHATKPARCALLAGALCVAFDVAVPDDSLARMATAHRLGTMARDAARIFRGHCTSAKTGVLEIAGARLPVTVYRFRVGEHLKGGAARTVTFRQLGTRDGGARDLGRLVGLPMYTPGSEYVLFLLPGSTAGMTSPAGAGDGAFLVHGDRLHGVHTGVDTTSPSAALGLRAADDTEALSSYEALRQAVRAELAR